MQCSCGSEALERKVTRDKKTVGKYMRCPKCGRCEIPAELRQLMKDEERGKTEDDYGTA